MLSISTDCQRYRSSNRAKLVGQYREEILKILTEPRTPNEVATMVKCNQHTAQNELMEVALQGMIKHKKVGRTHIFWRD